MSASSSPDQWLESAASTRKVIICTTELRSLLYEWPPPGAEKIFFGISKYFYDRLGYGLTYLEQVVELAADVPVQGPAVCCSVSSVCSVCSVCSQAGEQVQTGEGAHHAAVHPPAQQQVPPQHQVVPPAVPRLVPQQRLVCNQPGVGE